MIDTFALALSHGLMLVMAWRLLSHPELDDDSGKPRQTFTPEETDSPGA